MLTSILSPGAGSSSHLARGLVRSVTGIQTDDGEVTALMCAARHGRIEAGGRECQESLYYIYIYNYTDYTVHMFLL